jgi:hypothetical protein
VSRKSNRRSCTPATQGFLTLARYRKSLSHRSDTSFPEFVTYSGKTLRLRLIPTVFRLHHQVAGKGGGQGGLIPIEINYFTQSRPPLASGWVNRDQIQRAGMPPSLHANSVDHACRSLRRRLRTVSGFQRPPMPRVTSGTFA